MEIGSRRSAKENNGRLVCPLLAAAGGVGVGLREEGEMGGGHGAGVDLIFVLRTEVFLHIHRRLRWYRGQGGRGYLERLRASRPGATEGKCEMSQHMHLLLP